LPLPTKTSSPSASEAAQLLARHNHTGGLIPHDHPWAAHTAHLARVMGGVTICRKGWVDIISDGSPVAMYSGTRGSPRRCGGQGDILAGLVATFGSWAQSSQAVASGLKSEENHALDQLPPLFLATFAASQVLRGCSQRAYAAHRRSTLTTDILPEIEHVMEKLFPSPDLTTLHTFAAL